MKPVVVILLLLASSIAASAQFALPEGESARSMSGQFIVRGPVGNQPQSTRLRFGSTDDLLALEPSFLVVSCERIKQAVWRELGVSGSWSGTIFIALRPARDADDTVTVVCNRFRDGWEYQLDMPQPLEKRIFMRTVVQTVLLELANRNAGRRSVEIPQWLTEGLVQQLLASSEGELMLPTPDKAPNGMMITRTVIEKRQTDPLASARQILGKAPPLTLEQLCWPTVAQLAREDGGIYQSSAQLFTSELLNLKNGPACMSAMLGELARCYNWQTAFLRAFRPHFSRMLDVEKWWALQMVNFTGRAPSRLWTLEESRRKLDEILLTPAQVRQTTDQLPLRTELTLQTVIAEWDFARQKSILDDKVSVLDFLRFRLAPELAGLAGEYQNALAGYLDQRAKGAFTLPGSKLPGPTVKGLVRDTVKQLDALDEKRTALKSAPKIAGVVGE